MAPYSYSPTGGDRFEDVSAGAPAPNPRRTNSTNPRNGPGFPRTSPTGSGSPEGFAGPQRSYTTSSRTQDQQRRERERAREREREQERRDRERAEERAERLRQQARARQRERYQQETREPSPNQTRQNFNFRQSFFKTPFFESSFPDRDNKGGVNVSFGSRSPTDAEAREMNNVFSIPLMSGLNPLPLPLSLPLGVGMLLQPQGYATTRSEGGFTFTTYDNRNRDRDRDRGRDRSDSR